MAFSFARIFLLVLLFVASASASAESALTAALQAEGTAPGLTAPDGAEGAPGLATAPAPVIELSTPSLRVLTLDLTRDANDIWDRIRRGFGMADLDSGLVAEQQLFYINRPAFLKKVFERGGRYLYHIVDELERRGMPTELALLPMVESSYNPMAYSRSHASGLWQFIPSTGKSYNLTQDSWVDERRDVVASTSAALDYLQTIYEMHGDWHLALASYNWGENAVARAIQRNEAEGLPTDYSSLRMPDETRHYVPKLQALKNIVAQPELYRFELPYVPNTRHFVTVDTPATIDLPTAARLAGMPLEEFLALNPSHNRAAITEGSPLVVPVDRAEQFRLRLAEHQRDGKRWRTHELQKGETLASVARAFGLTLNQLYQLNGLTSRSRVSPGYSLLVPEGGDPQAALAAAEELDLAPGIVRRPIVPPLAAGRSVKIDAKSAGPTERKGAKTKDGARDARKGGRTSKASGKASSRSSASSKSSAKAANPAAAPNKATRPKASSSQRK